ncbi:type II toxin-antitoxin system death-on-curing family toxin [Geochorda subterranea]|uniref:Type II toxin-antitoxin system death-on-curing family toxin n=1 Tax=Geochorda subterranea TaxID=3109564 RepID=A0ABZ1BMW5_9FIRM|nr:type II toxin-antitoxin system death-on-curing family toxin [Limnochorda sp. LNt]WRP13786.1 type II toxin-antitoxin system death-on-curing family toxin [Limnochorda sp. LNt]
MLRYPRLPDVLFLHEEALRASGGMPGIRDLGLIESALARPRACFGGRQLYRTRWEKAAALLHSLVKNHGFVDGNKRAAWATVSYFLEQNGQTIVASPSEIVGMLLEIEADRLDVPGIARWLLAHARPLPGRRSPND